MARRGVSEAANEVSLMKWNWNKRLGSLAVSPRLLLALLLSLVFHAWMAGGLDGWLPEEESPETQLIRVELAKLPPPASKPKPVPVPSPKATSRQLVPPPPEVPPAPVAKPEPPMEPNSELAPPPVNPPEKPAPVLDPTPVVEPVEDSSAAIEVPMPKVPGRVAIEYQILRKGGVAGVEHHRYEAKADGSYVLTSLAEAKGLLALALSDLVQRSEGQVTPQGLRPMSYLYQYGKNVDKAQKASFDWSSGQLTMETGSRRQTVALQDGTQDLMSFLYQFMFVPPLQDLQLAVTNGKKLKVYNYGFEGEETLTTRMGSLRTLHIGKSGSDGEEKTEIWLAADHHYLPVKISKTEKDGTVTERIATHLQIEE